MNQRCAPSDERLLTDLLDRASLPAILGSLAAGCRAQALQKIGAGGTWLKRARHLARHAGCKIYLPYTYR